MNGTDICLAMEMIPWDLLGYLINEWQRPPMFHNDVNSLALVNINVIKADKMLSDKVIPLSSPLFGPALEHPVPLQC
jgi:hypothetical protein